MNKKKTPQEIEISFDILVEVILRGKWIIILFSLIGFLFGNFSKINEESIYSSLIIISEKINPPFAFYSSYDKFESHFYSKENFQEWSQITPANSLFKFEDFNNTLSINGFSFIKNEANPLTSIEEKKEKYFNYLELNINSNQFDTINQIYNYALYTNKTISNLYLSNSIDEIKIIESLNKKDKLVLDTIYDRLINLNIFINIINKGEGILEIKKPTFPKKINKGLFHYYFVYPFIGAIIGFFLTILIQIYRARK